MLMCGSTCAIKHVCPAGWQNHPVCTCRYHFIVPLVENMYVTAASIHDLPGHTEGETAVYNEQSFQTTW